MTSLATSLCSWCATEHTNEIADRDFGPSPGYCSVECETLDGHYHELVLREREQAATAAYALHAFNPDWRQYLSYAPDGAARCRNCTSLYSADSDSEFCSAECESNFTDDYRRWCDREDRFSDTQHTAA